MWIKNRKRIRFQKAKLRESSEALDNPGCGWYHVYPFVIQVSAAFSLEETQACISDISKNEQLVLALIDISAFRSCVIPEEALEVISGIFGLFHRNQKQMIVRFTYDSEGKGMEREPHCIDLIKKHMEQLGGIICAFASDILVLQGIFVGSWGEMHDSKFLSVSDMSELMCSLYRATEERCFLAVRTPEQWRSITDCAGTAQALKKRIGLFNDGMFGSPTDLGTYKEGFRQEELEWQQRFMAFMPNGGEAVAGEMLTGYRKAAEEMRKMHLCYLNSSYQQTQLDYWKKECVKESGCWNRLSGYEYIGRHLGGRFVICDVKVCRKELKVSIENIGFSRVYEETECFLVIEKKTGKTICQRIDTNVTEWESGKRIVLQIPLLYTERETGEDRLFLQMRRKRDGRPLRFANQNAEERVLLGTIEQR